MNAAIDPQAAAVLDFWFGVPEPGSVLQTRPEWFRKDEAFDADIRQRFGTLIDTALRGELASWAEVPGGALALVIVLDQFTRNTRRGGAGMFAGDAMALAIARRVVAAGWDRAMPGVHRQFVYLPFEHSEDLADQHDALRLFTQLGHDEPALAGLPAWAQKHLDVVQRFGRFPHRNAALGRISTSEEIKYLAQPGSGF